MIGKSIKVKVPDGTEKDLKEIKFLHFIFEKPDNKIIKYSEGQISGNYLQIQFRFADDQNHIFVSEKPPGQPNTALVGIPASYQGKSSSFSVDQSDKGARMKIASTSTDDGSKWDTVFEGNGSNASEINILNIVAAPRMGGGGTTQLPVAGSSIALKYKKKEGGQEAKQFSGPNYSTHDGKPRASLYSEPKDGFSATNGQVGGYVRMKLRKKDQILYKVLSGGHGEPSMAGRCYGCGFEIDGDDVSLHAVKELDHPETPRITNKIEKLYTGKIPPPLTVRP